MRRSICKPVLFLLLLTTKLGCNSDPVNHRPDASVTRSPVVNSISPSKGFTNGGTLVEVYGEYFLPGASLLVGGIPATSVEVVDSNTIIGLTPSSNGCMGLVDVEITNPDGHKGVGADLYRYYYEDLLFSVTPTIPLENSGASAMVLQDATNDGIKDLIVVHEKSEDNPCMVCVMEGIGEGEFNERQCYSLGSDICSPTDMVGGDLNGDGLVDLAIAKSHSNEISVVTQTESGVFVEEFIFPLGQWHSPYRVEVDDLDKDNDIDLVVAANRFSAYFIPDEAWLIIGLNRGNGWFDFFDIHYVEGMSIYALELGDINDDGITDIVHSQLGELLSWLGNGDGTFELTTQFQLASRQNDVVYAVELAEGDHDQFLDLYSIAGEALWLTPEQDGELVTMKGVGDGSFSTPTRTDIGPEPFDIEVKHLDDDGYIDVAVADRSYSAVTIFRGGGEITSTGSFSHGSNPRGRLISEDINDDGNGDLLVLNPHSVSTVINRGSFSFIGQHMYRSGISPRSVVSLHVNDDGIVDLAVLNVDDQTIQLLLGQGDGMFLRGPSASLDFNANMMSGFDQSDGSSGELVLSRSSASFDIPQIVEVIDIHNSGSLEVRSSVSVNCNPAAIIVGDWDSNNIVDLAVLYEGFTDPVTSEQIPSGVMTFRGSADGTLSEWELTDIEDGSGSLVCSGNADINEDGLQDIVVGRSSSMDLLTEELLLLTGSGDGGFEKTIFPVEIDTAATDLRVEMTSCALGDYDGDGYFDLMVATRTFSDGDVYRDQVSFFTGSGNGSFEIGDFLLLNESSWPPLPSKGMFSSTRGDMDGDGASDLFLLDREDKGFSILRIDGISGKFESPEFFNTGGFISEISVNDFDNDGDQDVAAVGDNIQVRVLLNGLGSCRD